MSRVKKVTNSQNLDDTYTILRKVDKVEIREYKPLLYVAYLDKEKKSGQNSYFRVLADYIFGANETNEKIAMTSPVVIKLHNDREMLFRLPKKYNKTQQKLRKRAIITLIKLNIAATTNVNKFHSYQLNNFYFLISIIIIKYTLF